MDSSSGCLNSQRLLAACINGSYAWLEIECLADRIIKDIARRMPMHVKHNVS